MKLSIIEIKKLCNLILGRVEKTGLSEIDVNFDYYRDFDDKYELDEECPKLMIGSFVDDLESLKKILNNKDPITPLDFERLGNVIKILGDELDRSGNVIFFENNDIDKNK